ncbi:hypothetical protein K402DRAFT_343333 [Aulographum hederae CBS 113979]|uniref:CENP-V/GFA domain-containing protein n=1 Tax=Aulographum hederae CBS 113979 TaxID=1176131 RepID=A0A6G1GJQ4_9PEZI|nr:hypothetical protein K402DRAFT_343333 [Aulographum hederae CBS 113979]
MAKSFTGDPSQYGKTTLNPLRGHCLCGSIHVAVDDPELFSRPRALLCHCANCRKTSGSIFSTNLAISENKVQIEDKDNSLKKYVDKDTGSGTELWRYFCGNCGNSIKSETALLSGTAIVKMGIFPVIPSPAMECFALHRQDWEQKLDGVVQYKFNRADGEMEQ